MQTTNAIRETAKRIGSSATFKLITICALILVLLVPTSMVTSLIHERKSRKQGVIDEINFGVAYLISAGAVIILITGYAKAILKNRVVTLMVGGILVILYAYLYILLQLEDYALLMGSIGLFFVLSVIMYLTRKIDWYASSQEIRKSNPAQPLDATTR